MALPPAGLRLDQVRNGVKSSSLVETFTTPHGLGRSPGKGEGQGSPAQVAAPLVKSGRAALRPPEPQPGNPIWKQSVSGRGSKAGGWGPVRWGKGGGLTVGCEPPAALRGGPVVPYFRCIGGLVGHCHTRLQCVTSGHLPPLAGCGWGSCFPASKRGRGRRGPGGTASCRSPCGRPAE